jgi:hypothetical protein
MSFLTSTIINEAASPVKQQFQPVFPLEYDGTYGPYAPITELEETIGVDFQNLLFTSPGEWPMSPSMGVGLKRYLFEMHTSPELPKLKERIQRQLDENLNSVQLIDVKYDLNPEQVDQNLAKITIVYSILSGALVSIESYLNSIGKIMVSINNHGAGSLTDASLVRNRALVGTGNRLISDIRQE